MVLGQLDDDGQEHMCACVSRSSNMPEVKNSSYKGEMLTAVWATKMFRHHLVGDRPFRLIIDHQPLLYLMSSSEGLTRQYVMVLHEYNFSIEHRPSVKQLNANTLPRHPIASSIDNSGPRFYEEKGAQAHATPTAPKEGIEQPHRPLGPQPPAEVNPLGAAVQLNAHNSTQAARDCEAVYVALTTAQQAAPFSESFIYTPEKSMEGWNG